MPAFGVSFFTIRNLPDIEISVLSFTILISTICSRVPQGNTDTGIFRRNDSAFVLDCQGSPGASTGIDSQPSVPWSAHTEHQLVSKCVLTVVTDHHGCQSAKAADKALLNSAAVLNNIITVPINTKQNPS